MLLSSFLLSFANKKILPSEIRRFSNTVTNLGNCDVNDKHFAFKSDFGDLRPKNTRSRTL